MTIENNEVSVLKTQVFRLADELSVLYKSYEGLQVIAASASCDSENVAAVVCGLNYRFESLLADLERLYKRDV